MIQKFNLLAASLNPGKDITNNSTYLYLKLCETAREGILRRNNSLFSVSQKISFIKYREKQIQTWIKYLTFKGYDSTITKWLEEDVLRYDILNSKANKISSTSAIIAIAYEYNLLLRTLKKWIIDLLIEEKKSASNQLFSEWSESNLDKQTIMKNLLFVKRSGVIKAWYDGCEPSYDGIKFKKIVHLSFIDIATYKNENGTSEWSYISGIWKIGGFDSGIEEYTNTLTLEGINWILSKKASNKDTTRISRWLIGNVFSILGS